MGVTVPYLTADEVRSRISAKSFQDSTYSDTQIEGCVSEFEDVAERYRGVAYTSRSASETIEIVGSSIRLRPQIQAIHSISVDGATQSGYQSDLATGQVWWLVSSPRTPYADVSYTHGFSDAPPAVLRACALFVRNSLIADDSTVSRDTVSITADGVTSRFYSADWAKGRPTGMNDVDRILNNLVDYRTLRMVP